MTDTLSLMLAEGLLLETVIILVLAYSNYSLRKSIKNKPQLQSKKSVQLQEKNDAIALLKQRLNTLSLKESGKTGLETDLFFSKNVVKNLEEKLRVLQASYDRLRNYTQSSNHLDEEKFGPGQAKTTDRTETVKEEVVRLTINSIEKSQARLSTIKDITTEESEIMQQLMKSIDESDLYIDDTADSLKKTIYNLKKNLIQSNREVGQLNYELSALKSNMDTDKHTRSVLVIERGSDDDRSFDDQQPPVPGNEDHIISRDKTLDQIHRLQDNNVSQRQMIVELNREISMIKADVNQNSELTGREIFDKNSEIARLEQMVKECGHCITTLESEVDLMFDQLSGVFRQQEIEDLKLEMSEMDALIKSTLLLYDDQSTITKFAAASTAHDNPTKLIESLDETLRYFGVIPGIDFRLRHSSLKVLPPAYFSQSDMSAIKSPTKPKMGKVTDYDDRILFWDQKVSIMITDLPDSDKRVIQIKDSVSMILEIAAEQVFRLSTTEINQKQSESMGKLVTATHGELENIEIQRKYISQEFLGIVASISKDIENICQDSGLSKPLQFILKNSVDDLRQRTDLLLSSGKIVNKNFESLIERLNQKLPKEELSASKNT